MTGKLSCCLDMAVITRSSLETGFNIALEPSAINKKEAPNKQAVNQNCVCCTELT